MYYIHIPYMRVENLKAQWKQIGDESVFWVNK